jgi:hypothetical protein
MEVRGLEPLTSGLQSPRSAKLSYTPKGFARCLARRLARQRREFKWA